MASRKVCESCRRTFHSSSPFIAHLLSVKHTRATQAHKLVKKSKGEWIAIEGYQQDKGDQDAIPHIDILTYFYKLNMVTALLSNNRLLVKFSSRNEAVEIVSQKHTVKSVEIAVSQLIERRETPFPSKKRQRIPQSDKKRSMTKFLDKGLCERMQQMMDRQEVADCLIDLIRYIELSPEEVNERQVLMRKVLSVLQISYPGCDIFAFGSSVNGLGFSDCDLDLCTDVAFFSGEDDDKLSRIKLTRTLARRIRSAGFAYNIHPIGNANVPIVKFVDRNTEIHVDLSFKNSIPYHNTKLIKAYVENNDIVKPYIMILRYWAKAQNITGGGNPFQLITNYAFTMMCLFYLMVRKDPIIPSVLTLQSNYHKCNYPPVIVDYWDCSFIPDVRILTGQYYSTMQLLHEFFVYYSMLDIKEYIICPRQGRLLELKMESEAQSRVIDGEEIRFKVGILNLQDPFMYTSNLTRALQVERCKKFQNNCQTAALIIEKIMHKELPLLHLFDTIKVNNENDTSRSNSKKIKTGEEEKGEVQVITEITRNLPLNKTNEPKEVEIVAEVNKTLRHIQTKESSIVTVGHGLETVSKFKFNFFRPVNIASDGILTKFEVGDNLANSAANLILIIMKECLLLKINETDYSETKPCEHPKKCVLNRTCSVLLNLLDCRKKIRRSVAINSKDPFSREVETSKVMLTNLKKEQLLFEHPITVRVHVCEELDNKNMFEVLCEMAGYMTDVNKFYTLFRSVVDSVMKQLSQIMI